MCLVEVTESHHFCSFLGWPVTVPAEFCVFTSEWQPNINLEVHKRTIILTAVSCHHELLAKCDLHVLTHQHEFLLLSFSILETLMD